MNKKDLSERDICTKFITPALIRAAWEQHQFREEVNLTKGRLMVRGKLANVSVPGAFPSNNRQTLNRHINNFHPDPPTYPALP